MILEVDFLISDEQGHMSSHFLSMSKGNAPMMSAGGGIIMHDAQKKAPDEPLAGKTGSNKTCRAGF